MAHKEPVRHVQNPPIHGEAMTDPRSDASQLTAAKIEELRVWLVEMHEDPSDSYIAEINELCALAAKGLLPASAANPDLIELAATWCDSTAASESSSAVASLWRTRAKMLRDGYQPLIAKARAPLSERQRTPFLPMPWRYEDSGEGKCVKTGKNYGDIYCANGRMVAETVYEDDAKAILEAMAATDKTASDKGQG